MKVTKRIKRNFSILAIIFLVLSTFPSHYFAYDNNLNVTETIHSSNVDDEENVLEAELETRVDADEEIESAAMELEAVVNSSSEINESLIIQNEQIQNSMMATDSETTGEDDNSGTEKEEVKSNNADLKKISITPPIGEVILDEHINQYEYIVDATVEDITITPTATDDGAVITIANELVNNNEAYSVSLNEGTNRINIQVTAEDGITKRTITLTIYRNFANTASRIHQFLPAPGQFVNKDPWGLFPEKILYSSGTTQGVSLGSFGGYVIFEFNEPIKNDPNNLYGVDFIVFGNAFKGNEEPGAIQVKAANDDTWYDIAGSEHYEDETIVNYEITYENPHANFEEPATNVPWQDNRGNKGEVKANNFHRQAYYPNPELYSNEVFNVSNEELTFSGVKLNKRNPAFGYTDVYQNGTKSDTPTNPYNSNQNGAPIDIAWAVDKDGQPVHLEEIKYVKVYTAMLEDLGAFGELSTEVTGIVRAKQAENVGQTNHLEAIKIVSEDEEVTVQIDENKDVYSVEIDADQIQVIASGEVENIFINNEKTDADKPSKKMILEESEMRTVRVIGQDGNNQPNIYYLNITNRNENAEPIVNKEALIHLINEAESIELENKTENSKNHLLAVLQEANEIAENREVTQQEVDAITQKLEKAMTNLKERAPPVTVDVRIEAHDKTIVEKITFEVEAFDIKEYLSNYNGDALITDEPRAIHAIIQALETVTELNLKDEADFTLLSLGNYISKIGDYGEFTKGPLSGWLYYVNHDYVNVGVGDYKLEDGDSIVLYFVENFTDSTYTWFEDDFYTTKVGEEILLKLNGNNWENLYNLDDIALLIDDIEGNVNKETVYFNENGYTTISFTEPGTYHLSAIRKNNDGQINIVRPYAIVQVDEDEVIEDADTEPPVITVTNITNGEKVTEETVQFKVNVTDEKDGELVPTVLLNGKEITLDASSYYIANLTKGTNTISITAKDNAGNQATKVITLIYEPLKTKINVDEALDKVINYVLNKGVSSEWQAIGLAKSGVEIPESYVVNFYENIEAQITNMLESGRIKITDIERLALAALAIDLDPTNIDGINLIELLYDSPMHRNGSDTMTLQGNNGLSFALIALDAGVYDIPKDAKWTREKIIAEILAGQKENGGWSLNAAFPSTSVDVTAMVLTALEPYKDQPKVKEAIERALQYLQTEQIENGGFDGGAIVGGETSEATAQVIIALATLGIDPTGESFTKSQNLVEHLLSFQNEDGGFRHTHDYPNSNGMATEQALLALVAYTLFLEGEGKLYHFDQAIEEDQDEIDENENTPIDDEKAEEDGEKTSDDDEMKQQVQVIDVSKLDVQREIIIDVTPGGIIVFETNDGKQTSKLQLPENLPEGTKVKISRPHLPKNDQNLIVTGDAFDITIVFPEGAISENDTFIYTLTLTVNERISLEKADIYHLNEQEGIWEIIPAVEKDEENHTITVNIPHFSIYAVLTENEENASENNGSSETGNTNSESTETQNEPNTSSGNNVSIVEDKANGEVTDSKHVLPNTATNLFNLIFIGLLLIVIGSVFYTYQKRKVGI